MTKKQNTGKNTSSKRTSLYGVKTRNPRNISQYEAKKIEDTAQGVERESEKRTRGAKLGRKANRVKPTGNETLGKKAPPYRKGSQSISGHMPDPSSDDNTLDASHRVGIKQKDTSEKKKKTDLASDRDRAENYYKEH